MLKILDYAPVTSSGEPTIRVVNSDLRRGLVKTASDLAISPRIREYISGIKARANKIFAIINAMGASEFYGPNLNGDAFSEPVLKEYHPTFVSDALPYMHHINKDPNKCYGKVLASDYNDLMHRVELVIEYDLSKLDRKYADKIANGDVVNVSMGCRVPYDICSICGNIAKTPDEYCGHLTNSPGLGKILPDGRRAFAINTKPTFFDISIVTIPADSTARILLKVANRRSFFMSSAKQAEAMGLEKKAETISVNLNGRSDAGGMPVEDALRKAADVIEDMMYNFDSAIGPDICNADLDNLGKSFGDPLSLIKSLVSQSVFLRPQEVQRSILASSGMTGLADKLERAKVVLMNDPSSFLGKIDSAPCCNVNGKMPQDLFEDRQLTPENVKRIVIRFVAPSDCKLASLQRVPVSDDFRVLAGQQQIEKIPTVIDDPLTALKSYLAIGSLVSAFNTMLGRQIAAPLGGGTMLAAALSPQFFGVMKDLNERANSPVQEMTYVTERDMPNLEAALINALALARANPNTNPTGEVKIGSIKVANSLSHPGFGLRSILALPLAYGAAKLLSEQAKRSAEEDSRYTGKYEPSFLAKPEYSFMLALPMVLKYASATSKVKDYLKGMGKDIFKDLGKVSKKTQEDVVDSMKKTLFSKARSK